jgi:hypothetical protein
VYPLLEEKFGVFDIWGGASCPAGWNLVRNAMCGFIEKLTRTSSRWHPS